MSGIREMRGSIQQEAVTRPFLGPFSQLPVARRIVKTGLEHMALKRRDLPKLRKSHGRKALITRILVEQTRVRQK